jgi:hypothetical protein
MDYVSQKCAIHVCLQMLCYTLGADIIGVRDLGTLCDHPTERLSIYVSKTAEKRTIKIRGDSTSKISWMTSISLRFLVVFREL